ncbi:Inner membrane protein YhcB [BD1-7 clade bacterium]|uniref:Z-ring associated protein G n=1 Tax=BD1-7 clade bacterium TaxID=2029982 RepID=A0A5S9N1W7_9GAMM|nr:Inner membrane protein YhcB [BD1-7 clade bacterium]
MEPNQLLLICSILSLFVGAAIGALITLRMSDAQDKNKELEKHLHQKQDELKQYQHEVTEHFVETSTMLNQLAETYRDLHNHLATGANGLTTPVNNNEPIIKRLNDKVSIEESSEPDTVQPPLDYAPRATPFDKGALNEDYGLEKVKLTEEPIENIADAIAANAATPSSDTQKDPQNA